MDPNVDPPQRRTHREDTMRVLIMGATGATGRAVTAELGRRGHHVTAFARRPETVDPQPWLATHTGDATSAVDVDAAVAGHDAVVITLGIRENPLAVRLRGPRHTRADVRSVGTRHAIDAMRRHGVRRLVVQATYGQGETAGRLSPFWRLTFALVLRPQIRDTQVQEALVRASGLDWVLIHPVSLTDETDAPDAVVSLSGDVAGMRVPRVAVARVLADAVEPATTRYIRRTASVSAA
jgi:nucleoside-diphosphate-sugar epimerase